MYISREKVGKYIAHHIIITLIQKAENRHHYQRWSISSNLIRQWFRRTLWSG